MLAQQIETKSETSEELNSSSNLEIKYVLEETATFERTDAKQLNTLSGNMTYTYFNIGKYLSSLKIANIILNTYNRFRYFFSPLGVLCYECYFVCVCVSSFCCRCFVLLFDNCSNILWAVRTAVWRVSITCLISRMILYGYEFYKPSSESLSVIFMSPIYFCRVCVYNFNTVWGQN